MINKAENQKHRTYDSVTLNGSTNLLRAGSHVESSLRLDSVLQSLFDDAGATAHIFVAGVGAAANKTCNDTQ